MRMLLTVCMVTAIMAISGEAIALDFTEVDLGMGTAVPITDEFADYCVTFVDVYRYIDDIDPFHEIGPQGGPTGYGIVPSTGSGFGIINFECPQPSVEIDWVTVPGVTIYVDAYDSGGGLVDSFSGTDPTGGIGSGTELLSGTEDISYMTFHDGTGNVAIANMRFSRCPCPMEVDVDIKPGSCPNPLNLKSKGVLPVAVLGTEDFDVTQIDPATVRLSREGVEASVAPLRWAYEDVATPFEGELCDCHDLGPDGYIDLTPKFNVPELMEVLELNEVAGETIPLILTGNLKEDFDGSPIRGGDCVWVLE